MNSKLITSTLIIVLLACDGKQAKDKLSNDYTFPPEWLEHKAVWIDWTNLGLGAFRTKIQIIKAIHKNVRVNLLTNSDSLGRLAIQMMIDASIDTSQTSIFFHPVPNYFIRDSGPKYLVAGDKIALADFGWNCYGFADYGADCYKRGETIKYLAQKLNLPMRGSDIVTEGGALEVNNSVIIAFEGMATSRNPGKRLSAIESGLLEIYGKKKMIWIKEIPLLDISGYKTNNYFGQGANGHIDEYMRFVNDSTLIVGVINSSEQESNPINKKDYHLLQRNLKQIAQETNANGRPFNIITIPMPDVSLYAKKTTISQAAKDKHKEWYKKFNVGDSIINVPIMSYLNFLITNKVVLISKYWKEGIPLKEKYKDELALNVFKNLFPDRDVIQIDPKDLNWYGGGIHCSTQQVPEVNGNP